MGRNFAAHIDKLLQQYRDRQMSDALTRAGRVIESGDGAREAVAGVLTAAAALDKETSTQDCDDYSTQGAELMERYLGGADPSPIRTGFASLDEHIMGAMPGDMIMLGARSGCGKSIFALNLASNAALQGKWVSFFALEMRNEVSFSRLLSLHSRVDSRRIRQRTFSQTEFERMAAAVNRLQGLPLRFFDGVTKLEEILAIARMQHAQ